MITRITEETARQAVAAAAEHQHEGSMRSSAQLALDDAIECLAKQHWSAAQRRALVSLAYSVGILSHVYWQHRDYT